MKKYSVKISYRRPLDIGINYLSKEVEVCVPDGVSPTDTAIEHMYKTEDCSNVLATATYIGEDK